MRESVNTTRLNNTEENITLRACSYNIHKGFSAANRRFLLKDIRRAIRLVNADLVFLQEVVGENISKAGTVKNWSTETQFEFLADSVWPHYAYGKNSVYDHGHHGNAILSHHVLSDWNNTDLSILPFSSRGMLHAKILGKLHVFCVHCGLLSFERNAQLKQMVNIIRHLVADDEAIIVAGDFNDWQYKAGPFLASALGLTDALSETHGKPQATFPAFLPFLAMDRMYFRGLDLLTSEVLRGEPWERLSDHCAVYAEFRLRQPQTSP